MSRGKFKTEDYTFWEKTFPSLKCEDFKIRLVEVIK